MLAEEDVEVDEGLGRIGVGSPGDVEGLGELAAGVVGDQRGEDGNGPVTRRDAERGEGGRQDAGVPGAAPVRAIDGDGAGVVEVALGGEQVALLDGPDGGVGVVPAGPVDVDGLGVAAVAGTAAGEQHGTGQGGDREIGSGFCMSRHPGQRGRMRMTPSRGATMGAKSLWREAIMCRHSRTGRSPW